MRHYNEDIYLTYWTLLLQQIEDNHWRLLSTVSISKFKRFLNVDWSLLKGITDQDLVCIANRTNADYREQRALFQNIA